MTTENPALQESDDDQALTRTLIQIEVLSNGAYTFESLAALANDVVNGDCSGASKVVLTQRLTRPQMAKALLAQGSDPDFLIPDWDPDELAAEPTAEPTAEDGTIVVEISGGVLSRVSSVGVDARLLVLDYDTDGKDDAARMADGSPVSVDLLSLASAPSPMDAATRALIDQAEVALESQRLAIAEPPRPRGAA